MKKKIYMLNDFINAKRYNLDVMQQIENLGVDTEKEENLKTVLLLTCKKLDRIYDFLIQNRV